MHHYPVNEAVEAGDGKPDITHSFHERGKMRSMSPTDKAWPTAQSKRSPFLHRHWRSKTRGVRVGGSKWQSVAPCSHEAAGMPVGTDPEGYAQARVEDMRNTLRTPPVSRGSAKYHCEQTL